MYLENMRVWIPSGIFNMQYQEMTLVERPRQYVQYSLHANVSILEISEEYAYFVYSRLLKSAIS